MQQCLTTPACVGEKLLPSHPGKRKLSLQPMVNFRDGRVQCTDEQCRASSRCVSAEMVPFRVSRSGHAAPPSLIRNATLQVAALGSRRRVTDIPPARAAMAPAMGRCPRPPIDCPRYLVAQFGRGDRERHAARRIHGRSLRACREDLAAVAAWLSTQAVPAAQQRMPHHGKTPNGMRIVQHRAERTMKPLLSCCAGHRDDCCVGVVNFLRMTRRAAAASSVDPRTGQPR